MKAYEKIKAELTEIAQRIREMKQMRQRSKNGYVSGLHRNRCNFRVKHIAACEMRGMPRDRIENPRKGNVADEKAIMYQKERYNQFILDDEKKKNMFEMDENTFTVIPFPDIQDYQDLDGFDENSTLINDGPLMEEYGSSAYMVRCNWLHGKQEELDK